MGLTDASKTVVHSYFYDDFGNLLGEWGNVDNRYLYTGQEYDGAISGLYNLRARYYDSGVGRFVSEDPLQRTQKQVIPLNPHELNVYLYVLNNPVNWVDPLGLKGIKKCTSKEVKKELKQITEAFRRCCKRGFRPPCYEKSEKIIECMYIIIGGKLDCCDYGIHFMPQFWFIFHYGIRADCYDCCGRHYQKYFEPFLCLTMPTQILWW
ncbi:MAG: RHS repeat-associated core domain-containing protein [bacterium]